MTDTAAAPLGITAGQVVREVGWDDDADDALRDAVRELAAEQELIDDDTDDEADVVLLWWRDGDGDLFDTLTDAMVGLGDDGVIWLLTPKVGRDGHVEPSDIGEDATTAGLRQVSSSHVAPDWTGTKLAKPRSR
ncbi:DUF3052 domain-containing protein [Actinokineospora sp. G85]|uniref:DUF3052 domain-containing protein n=1 Tax=Actinokineospora TaxID=39845 RepID=UPI0012EAA808|nr:DUF3052 domain-containing protein [Actinokineospora pegani]